MSLDAGIGGPTRRVYPGHRPFVPGPFPIGGPDAPAREIVSVRHCRVDQLTDRDAREVGLPGGADLRARLVQDGARPGDDVTVLALRARPPQARSE